MLTTISSKSDPYFRLDRFKKLFGWGDMPEDEYLTEKRKIERELALLKQPESDTVVLDRLAAFLTDVAQAWREANHEQRNSLGRQLFDEIWIKDKQVIAVKPRPELEPFFRLSYEEWKKEFESADLSPIGVATSIPLMFAHCKVLTK